MISKQTLDFITKWEGFRPRAYLCEAKKATIGIGTTRYFVLHQDRSNKYVNLNDTISLAEAYAELTYFLLHNCKLPKIPLTENQKTAIYSLQYNIGLANWNNSSVLKKIVGSDTKESIRQSWLAWNKVTINGKKVVSNGLSKRREDEIKLFFS